MVFVVFFARPGGVLESRSDGGVETAAEVVMQPDLLLQFMFKAFQKHVKTRVMLEAVRVRDNVAFGVELAQSLAVVRFNGSSLAEISG